MPLGLLCLSDIVLSENRGDFEPALMQGSSLNVLPNLVMNVSGLCTWPRKVSLPASCAHVTHPVTQILLVWGKVEVSSYGGLKENGPQREWHYWEVWLCWRKCVTVGVGFEVSYAQFSVNSLLPARCRTLSYSNTMSVCMPPCSPPWW